MHVERVRIEGPLIDRMEFKPSCVAKGRGFVCRDAGFESGRVRFFFCFVVMPLFRFGQGVGVDVDVEGGADRAFLKS